MTAINIEITVDFDSIVKNITPVKNVYSNCENYVSYSGKPVNGTTISLIKGNEYTFTLEAHKGNSCTATKLDSFASQDSNLTFKSDTNALQLDCTADTIDTNGVDVTLTVTFKDNNTGSTATWDPKIKVIGGG